jgi:hypothetical protein
MLPQPTISYRAVLAGDGPQHAFLYAQALAFIVRWATYTFVSVLL